MIHGMEELYRDNGKEKRNYYLGFRVKAFEPEALKPKPKTLKPTGHTQNPRHQTLKLKA